MSKFVKKISLFLALALMVCSFSFPENDKVFAKTSRKDYGVFIGVTKLDYKKLGQYNQVVIDAEYFSRTQIKKLKKAGVKKVYSYLNIGSLEEFRSYYDKYKDLTLGDYENWEGEHWMDVSSKRWQDFCVSKAKKLKAKGIDGMFIDNCDVYYQYKTDKTYKGLVKILSRIRQNGSKIIINGGDSFVTRRLKESKKKLFDAVNQECVYTRIDFSKKKFYKAKKSERVYFTKYLSRVKKAGVKVYVLEYSTSKKLTADSRKYAKKYGWGIYVASKLELV